MTEITKILLIYFTVAFGVWFGTPDSIFYHDIGGVVVKMFLLAWSVGFFLVWDKVR